MGKTSSLAMLALKWVNAKGKFIHIIHVDPKDKPMVRSQIYNRLKALSHGAIFSECDCVFIYRTEWVVWMSMILFTL